MPWYTENISTTIFFIRVLFLSYELVKVYRNNMDHPVSLDILMIFFLNTNLPKCSFKESAPESSSSSGLKAYPGKMKGSLPLYLRGDLKSRGGGAAEKSLKSRLLGD